MKIIQMKPKQGYAKPDNYAAFYGLLKQMPGASKEEIVLQFTDGRTDSLREMSLHEYNEAIRAMEKLTRAEETEAMRILKRKRSDVLHQMQLSGVDTADWKRVDAFCLDKRIAGKPFAGDPFVKADEELERLLVKLRAIRRKQKEED